MTAPPVLAAVRSTDRMGILAPLFAAILLLPTLASAQAIGKVPRIGVLSGEYPPPRGDDCLDAFRRGLHEAGYTEAQTIAVEPRFSEANSKPWPPLAADLLRMRVDVIVAMTTTAALAARQATATIPIVMGPVSYPVEVGLVASLARPGGNVTGSAMYTAELLQKRMEVLRDAVPGATRMAAFRRTGGATGPVMDFQIRDFQTAAQRLGVQLSVFDVQRPEDIDRAFDAAVAGRAQAIVLPSSPLFRGPQLLRIAALGLRHEVPVLADDPGAADTGILLQFGAKRLGLCSRAAVFVDKLLKGARPADLPVEQPARIELVVNLKTATAIGLKLPPSVLVRADRVIQ